MVKRQALKPSKLSMSAPGNTGCCSPSFSSSDGGDGGGVAAALLPTRASTVPVQV